MYSLCFGKSFSFIFRKHLHESASAWPWLQGRSVAPRAGSGTAGPSMSKELQELQKQWHFIVQSIHSNSNVGLRENWENCLWCTSEAGIFTALEMQCPSLSQ